MGADKLDHRWTKLREECKRSMPWICSLCGDPIEKGLPKMHPMSWSLDHIIALHLGGDPYSIENVAPAHLGCNSRKGTRLQRANRDKSVTDWLWTKTTSY